MTHDAQCEWQYNRQFCGCAERALAQAQSRLTQLEAVVNTRDLAIKRWCDELAQAQGEIAALREALRIETEDADSLEAEVERLQDSQVLHPDEICLNENYGCQNRARTHDQKRDAEKIDRLTAALTAISRYHHKVVHNDGLPKWEACESGTCAMARAALTESRGQ